MSNSMGHGVDRARLGVDTMARGAEEIDVRKGASLLYTLEADMMRVVAVALFALEKAGDEERRYGIETLAVCGSRGLIVL